MKSNNLKRAAALGLAALMLAPSATFAKEFKDVKKKNNKYSWAYDAIDKLSDNNIISGHPDGEFKPGEPVSLEELLQLIKQILRPSDQEIKTAKEKYSKLAKEKGVNSWAEDAICLALHRGYLDENSLKKASERGFFKISGREYPSRGDIAIFFARALQLSPNGNTNLLKHNDKDKMSDTLKGYLSSLVDAKIFTSTGSDGNFEGERSITRAETAIITKASFDYAEKNKIEAKTEKLKGTVILSSKLNNVNVVIIETKGSKYSFDIDSNTKYKLKDKDIKLEDIKAGQEVEIEYVKAKSGEREGTAKTITVTNAMLDMVGYVNSKGNNQITLRYRDNSDSINFRTTSKISTSDTKTFDLDKNVKIKAYGKDLKLENIAVDDLVEFKTNSDNKITEMTVFPKEAYVKGQIISIENTNKDKSSIKLKLSDGKTYEFYITNETKDLDRLSFRDEISLYVNYKVAIGLASNYQRNTSLIGVIKDFSNEESSTSKSYRDNLYIDFEEENGSRQNYKFAYDPEIITNSGRATLNNIRKNEIIGSSAVVDLDSDGRVKKIEIIPETSKFKAMFQVVNISNGAGFRGIYSNSIELSVIQSNNRRLDSTRNLTINNANTFDRFAVISCYGYLDKNNNVVALFNVKEEGKAETRIQQLGYRATNNFKTFDEIRRNYSYTSNDSSNNVGIYY